MRSSFNRRALLAGGAGTFAALAAGCGDRDFQQVVGASIPREYRGRTTVSFWHSFSSDAGAALSSMVAEFNDSQDDIYVDASFHGSYEQTQQKVAAAIIARQIPDVVTFSEVTWRKMHLADTLEPLDDYFDDELTPDVYMDQFVEEGTVQDTVWWLPFARSTPMFYYNREMFERIGLPDRGPETWSEFREWWPEIEAFSQSEGRRIRALCLAGVYASWYFQGNVWAWGGSYSDDLRITIDDEIPIAAGQWMVDFIRRDRAAYLTQSTTDDFANGFAACSMFSTASLRSVTEQCPFPIGTGFLPGEVDQGCPTGGAGIAILRDAAPERKRAAFEFLKFLARPEKSAQWTMSTGYLPIVKSAQEDPELVALTEEDPNFLTALNQLPITRPQDLARPLVPNGGIMLDNALERLYSSNDSVESVFAGLANRLQARADLIEESYRERYT